VYRWTLTDGQWTSSVATSRNTKITAPKQTGAVPDTVVLTIDMDDLVNRPDSLCSVRFYYYHYDDQEGWIREDLAQFGIEDGHGILRIEGGYALGDATGRCTLMPESDAILCGDACFVDLRLTNTAAAVITPSTNPNCLYRLHYDAPVPPALAGRNVLHDYAADSLILHDGHDFFCPGMIRTNSVRYTRQMTMSVPSRTVWNSLSLPFEPSETSEPLGLFVPVADEPGYIFVDETTELRPYVPYFVRLAYDSTAALRHDVTFSAGSCILSRTPDNPMRKGEVYSVRTTCRQQEIEDAMVLSPHNDYYIKPGPVATVEPFSLWIKGETNFTDMLGSVILLHIVSTGTEEVLATPQASEDNAWYTVTGIRLGSKPTQPGAYIHNRKVEIVR